MRAVAVACALALVCGPSSAAAPRKAVPLAEPPMQVHVVRGAQPGCEPQCPQWIAAQGRIVNGSLAQFKKALRRLGGRKLPVLIDSSGGSVSDSLAIGRLIRANGLDVAVARTELAPCAPGDAACRKDKARGELRGVARASEAKCASACAFVLAGGARRFAGPGTTVGVHQIALTLRKYMVWTRRSFGAPVETQKTLMSERTIDQTQAQAKSTYANVARYLSEMGVGEEIMPLMMSTPTYGIRWLTPKELQATRLATHLVDGEELVTGVPTLTKAPSAPLQGRVPTLHDLMRYEGLCSNPAGCGPAGPPIAPDIDPNLNAPTNFPNVLIPGPEPAAPTAPPPSAPPAGGTQ